MVSKRKIQRKKAPVDKQTYKSLLRVILIVVGACLIAFAIPYGAWKLYRFKADEGSFKPENILISGNVRASDAEIKEAADLERDDINLVELNFREVRSAIEALPWVKTARIEAEYSTQTLKIQIEEHTPLGIVSENQLKVVDENGEFIKMWASTDELTPPIVSSQHTIEARSDIIVTAFALATRAHEMGYPHQVEEVHYDDATGYTLFTDSTEIRLGYDRFDERLDRLLDVDHYLAEKSVGAAYILLDAEDNLNKIYIKPDFSTKTGAEGASSK